jgi:hypothetical protein
VANGSSYFDILDGSGGQVNANGPLAQSEMEFSFIDLFITVVTPQTISGINCQGLFTGADNIALQPNGSYTGIQSILYTVRQNCQVNDALITSGTSCRMNGFLVADPV